MTLATPTLLKDDIAVPSNVSQDTIVSDIGSLRQKGNISPISDDKIHLLFPPKESEKKKNKINKDSDIPITTIDQPN